MTCEKWDLVVGMALWVYEVCMEEEARLYSSIIPVDWNFDKELCCTYYYQEVLLSIRSYELRLKA